MLAPASLFFFAFLPQFVSAKDAHGSLRMLGLSAVLMLVTFAVLSIYALRDRHL
nr:hypothetical protein [Solirubrobacterales bacterium]